MKRYLLTFVLLLSILTAAAQDLKARLEGMTGVKAVTELPAGEFDERYEVMIEQELDPLHPGTGTFLQRVLVMHAGEDRPTMLITQGYDATFGLNPRYREEISRKFDTNIVFVEHRYFAKSTPEPCDWKYLTAERSAYDLHRVRQMFGQLYDGKWIASGISKGGSTTMLYCAWFPEDCDIWVPYVGPLCNSAEDKRFNGFFERVGDAATREAVADYQHRLLTHRAEIMPMFEKHCAAKGYTFRIPLEEVYDYCVLEYAFSFWQWGHKADILPAANASARELGEHLLRYCSPDYFSKESTTSPFFVQAARELGYYPYDIRPFRKELKIKSSKDYLRRIFLPEELQKDKFDKALCNRVTKYLKKNDPKMIFIYGGNDPWTVPGATWVSKLGKQNMKVYIEPSGSHRTRINTLPEQMRYEAYATIAAWLAE